MGLFALGYTEGDSFEAFAAQTTSLDGLLTHITEAATAFRQAFPDSWDRLLDALWVSLTLEAW